MAAKLGRAAKSAASKKYADTIVRAAMVKKLWPRRSARSNKTHHGHLLVIGGSPGMEGAAVLAATAAARMGAGYVSLASPKVIPFDVKPPDFLTVSWKQVLAGNFGKATAVVLGPGLREDAAVLKLLKALKKSGLPAVVDAGALQACVALMSATKEKLPGNWILTPHTGELSRIIKIPSARIDEDRKSSVRTAAKMTGACILLKGFRTRIDDGERSYVIDSGNAALAKAGTGDVLSGFTGGLLARGLSVDQAGLCAAWVHGKIADRWVKQGFGQSTLLASDLPRLLRGVISSMENSK
jgi:NAD(P)H-hydrate epimerase